MSRFPPKTPTDGTPTALVDAGPRELAARALAEDVGRGDLTTQLVIDPSLRGRAEVHARQTLVVAGTAVAAAVFTAADPRLRVDVAAPDGSRVERGAPVLRVTGTCAPILTAERTALNFLQRLCGIASLAAEARARVEGTGVQLLDTRKTTPGLRRLEKEAVRAGGVSSYRMGLDDGILIKDNHVAGHGSPAEAVCRARAGSGGSRPVAVEIDHLDDLEEVIAAGASIVLLDNFSVKEVAEAVRCARGRVVLEASGGITLESLRGFAETGVDRISLGFLTHSAPAADLSLELEVVEPGRAS